MHKEWVIKAANAGKHILCEKPLALDEKDIEEMKTAADANGVKLMEAFMYRFTPRAKTLVELIKSGAIGKVGQIISNYSFFLQNKDNIRMSRELGGGSLHDVGCYPINIIGLITNDYPISIMAQKIEENGVDIALTASLKYRNNILATVNCSFLCDSCEVTEINGTKGSLIVRDTFYDSDLPILMHCGDSETVIEVPSCERYVLEVEAFTECILNDSEVPLSLDESIRNNRLIKQILEVAK